MEMILMGNIIKWNEDSIQKHMDDKCSGFKILSIYTDLNSDIEIICPNSHVFTVIPKSFIKRKDMCLICKKDRITADANQKIKEEVSNSTNYTIIDILDSRHVILRCDRKHKEYKVKFSNFYSGMRCRECAIEDSKGKTTLTMDFIKNYIEYESMSGYRLITQGVYKVDMKLAIECTNGHVYEAFFKTFRRGCRCPWCSKTKYTYEEVKFEFESRGYTVLSTEYINGEIKMDVICPKNHRIVKSFSDLLSGYGCGTCWKEGMSGENSPAWKGGITILNEYLRGFLNKWRKTSLEASNHLCEVTGLSGTLEVHHKYPFHKIVSEIMDSCGLFYNETIGDYSKEERDLLLGKFREYHDANHGAPLLRDVHVLYHRIFGDDNTEEQYNFFKMNYENFKSGEMNNEDYCKYLILGGR